MAVPVPWGTPTIEDPVLCDRPGGLEDTGSRGSFATQTSGEAEILLFLGREQRFPLPPTVLNAL